MEQGTSVDERKKLGFLFGNLKKVIDPILEQLQEFNSSIHEVKVTNPDTKLLKEVAQNTRGVKGAISELSKNTAANKPEKLPIQSFYENIIGKLDDLLAKKMETVVNVPEQVTLQNKILKTEVTNPIKEVTVTNLKDISIPQAQNIDISSLESSLNALKSEFSKIYDYLPKLKPKDITFPAQKELKIPDKVSVKEAKEIINTLSDGFQGFRDDLGELYKMIEAKEYAAGGGRSSAIVSSPAITSVNVNALRGVTKSTAVTVTTSATILPSNPIVNRKSLIVFNNSASDTLYIGGADVTSATGLPIPHQSYSPPIDAHDTHDVYAIVATGSVDARVLEVSSEREGAA